MHVKVRRMVSLVLLLAGSQAAYSQSSFLNNSSPSIYYSEEITSLSTLESQAELKKQWNQFSENNLSRIQIIELEKALSFGRYEISQLSKEEKQFLFKYQHLAIYLSGMNPINQGSFDRSGIWMLSYADATRYGLKVNEWVDERRDMAKSTRAAQLLFKDLKKRHGANTEVVFVLGAAGWRRTDSETIDSVEEDLTTLRLIAKNYRGADFQPTSSKWISQTFVGMVNVDVLTIAHGLDDLLFQQMNPTIIGNIIPKGTPVMLPNMVDGHRIVADSKLEEIDKIKRHDSVVNRVKKDIPSPLTHKVITHKVKSGDVLGRIAEHYGVRVSKIKKWNNLRSDRIDISQKLTIYYPNGKKVPTKNVAKKTPKPEVKLLAKEVGKFIIYEVQHGDTLWEISKKYEGVKPEDIMAWNAIGEDLSIGQKLKIKTLK